MPFATGVINAARTITIVIVTNSSIKVKAGFEARCVDTSIGQREQGLSNGVDVCGLFILPFKNRT